MQMQLDISEIRVEIVDVRLPFSKNPEKGLACGQSASFNVLELIIRQHKVLI